MAKLRSPICTVVGHVDHGKSTILDTIRGTSIVSTEAGSITQAIGASIVPIATIKKLCGTLLETLKLDFTIPGLLFIDTPGHAAFTNLRKRGGNLADIAILVIDINEGFRPQTIEAIEILKHYKTPFIIVANKIDLIQGWQPKNEKLMKNITSQQPPVQHYLDTKIYGIVGKLYEIARLEADRFDRVADYTRQIAIIPASAKTGEGIPELLMVISGLAQKYMEGSLFINTEGRAKGTVLEVKETQGIGLSFDVILYDGTLKVNDIIVIGSTTEPIVTKVKALFEPAPLSEMRDKKAKFAPVRKVSAATGVKIAAPGIDAVIGGMPLRSCTEEQLQQVKQELQKEVEEVIIETDKSGILLKADTLGSLEALITLFKEKKIPIRKASLGSITKKDIMDAEAAPDMLHKVIIGFNVSDESETKTSAKIFLSNIIYKLIEDFDAWRKEMLSRQKSEAMSELPQLCKITLLPNNTFRQSNPAVVGVDVIAGKLRTNMRLFKDNEPLTTARSIQDNKENIQEAEAGRQVAVSLDHVTIGRNLKEKDALYSYLEEPQFRRLKDARQYLSKAELQILKEIAELMRKENPTWGV